MTGSDKAASFIFLCLMLVLVGSAFFARRVPMRQGLKMLLAWAAIFGVAFVGFTLKDPLTRAGKRFLTEMRGVEQQGQTLRIKADPDGHFWVDATINDAPVRFMIDSGATITTISSDVARRANVAPSGGFKAAVSTANGMIMVDRGRAERLRLGGIEQRNLAVHISDSFGGTNVLGMNFLSALSGWGVENGWLVLRA